MIIIVNVRSMCVCRSDAARKIKHPEDESVIFYTVESFHLEATGRVVPGSAIDAEPISIDVSSDAVDALPSSAAPSPSLFALPDACAKQQQVALPFYITQAGAAIPAPGALVAVNKGHGITCCINRHTAAAYGLMTKANATLQAPHEDGATFPSIASEIAFVLATLDGTVAPFTLFCWEPTSDAWVCALFLLRSLLLLLLLLFLLLFLFLLLLLQSSFV